MGKYNFNYHKNNRYSNYKGDAKPLDIERLSNELVDKARQPLSKLLDKSYDRKQENRSNPVQVRSRTKTGVLIRFADGSKYSTPDLTIDEIHDQIHSLNGKWLRTYKNGIYTGEANTDFIVRYSPLTFYWIDGKWQTKNAYYTKKD